MRSEAAVRAVRAALADLQLDTSSSLLYGPSMAAYTSFRAGGEAAALCTVGTMRDLQTVLARLHEARLPVVILGNGTNTLFADGMFAGVVVRLGDSFQEAEPTATSAGVKAQQVQSAGAPPEMQATGTGQETAWVRAQEDARAVGMQNRTAGVLAREDERPVDAAAQPSQSARVPFGAEIAGTGRETAWAVGMQNRAARALACEGGQPMDAAAQPSQSARAPFGAEEVDAHREMQANGAERDAVTAGAPPEMQQAADDAIWCCGAAASLSTLARRFLEAGLTGFEFAAGIPGSLGGAVYMNAGAYDGEMRDVLVGAEGISPDGRTVRVFRAADLDLSYRHSALMETGHILTRVWLRLRRGDRAAIRARMQELAARRSEKQPLQYPSAGSTFKRPSGGFAAKLIEEADLKGVSVGGAQVSTLHSGFIINTGGATATDILDLMHLVQNTVYDRCGVKLEPEVRIVGQEGILGDTGGMA